MTNVLKYLYKQVKKEFSETYEQALENQFQYFLKKEYEDNYDINKARAEFKESTYYFLTLEDFEKSKLKHLQSLRNDAQNELINLIVNIDDLRETKKIYNKIVKIADSLEIKLFLKST
jgi:hypothetical protein